MVDISEKIAVMQHYADGGEVEIRGKKAKALRRRARIATFKHAWFNGYEDKGDGEVGYVREAVVGHDFEKDEPILATVKASDPQRLKLSGKAMYRGLKKWEKHTPTSTHILW